MGINNFFTVKIDNPKSKFHGKKLADLGNEIRLLDLRGKRVSVDVSFMIYSGLLAMDSVQSLTDAEGNPTSHINTILNKIIQLEESGISQVWIFDSPELNDMKKRALSRREKRREDAKESETLSKEDKEKRMFKMTNTHVEDIKMLLKCMGIMSIEAPPGIEAEQYGSFLSKGDKDSRYCQYIISADADVLLFGGNLMRITRDRIAKRTLYQAFELEDILRECDITYDQLVKVGVALGTDFNDKVDALGPAKVMKYVKEDRFYYSPDQYKAIDYFKSDISDKIGMSNAEQSNYSRKDTIDFLISKNFNKERIDKRLDTYEKARLVNSKST